MSTLPANGDPAAELKRALGLLREMRARLDSVERARTEPIAIVGLGCRVPGANNPAAFWELLRDGVDAITETPPDRWDSDALYDPDPLNPGTVATRWGGFLGDIDHFDADFFGIAPREAAQMDPQQRLLLEVTYEALEDAGQQLERLAGSRAGVFIGVHSQSSDYYLLQTADSAGMDVYSGTGTSHSVVAGRLAYLFDFRGPCVSVDTACSSSLVAVHLAVQSLRRGESDLALAGGVNLMLDPSFTIAASRMQMLAADGRCKTFDAAADGFVRSEGCGVVVLKRLSDALASGDPVQAVIYGSAMNQDGHSNGLTAPNGISQQAVVRDALKDAGVAPERIGYVEAHGTGTALGDPIEVEALATVLGSAAGSESRCLLGSAKANVGHLEGAAGVTSLIKTVLGLRHGHVPPLAHFRELNPHISLDGTPLAIPTELTPWPAGDAPRYAGVSSFGWSGTNAHVIVGDPPTIDTSSPEAETAGATEAPLLLPLSARSETALRELARSYAGYLRQPYTSSGHDIAFTAATRRSHLTERLAVTASSHEVLAERLAAFADGRPAAGIVTGSAAARPPRLVFVFPGQGGQWIGMGLRLAATEPVFAASLARCSAAIQAETGWSLLDVLEAPEESSRLHEISVVQPAIFAIQVALADLLADWGLRPDAVVGHSMGECAAAYVAGALSLEGAAAVICRRSRLLTRVAGQGAMGVVDLTLDEASELITPYAGRLSVAASNGPTTTVIAGDADALEDALQAVQGRGRFARRVQVDVASHSPQMDPLLPELETVLADLAPRPSQLEFISTVTGERITGPELGAAYWGQNLRQPVFFNPVISELMEGGETAFLELSPHPVLLGALEGAVRAADAPAIAVGALRRGQDEAEIIREAAGALWAAGLPIDWDRVTPGRVALPLPGYPWQHERYWFTGTGGSSRGQSLTTPTVPADAGLLGVPLPELAHLPGSRFWQGRIEPPDVSAGIFVANVPVLPDAAAVLIALAAAPGSAIENLTLEDHPLLTMPLETQTVLTPRGDQAELSLFTRTGADGVWKRWATARTTMLPTTSDPTGISSLQARLERLPEQDSKFQEVWRTADEALVKITPTDGELGLATMLHLACQVLGEPDEDEATLFDGADHATMHGDPNWAVWAYVRRDPDEGETLEISLRAEDGSPLASFRGVRPRKPDAEFIDRASTARLDDWLYTLDWQPCPLSAQAEQATGDWLVLSGNRDLGQQLVHLLEARGAHVCHVRGATNDPAVLALEIQEATDVSAKTFSGVIDLRALDYDDADFPTAARDYWGPALALAQALGQGALGGTARLWLVTRGAQAAGGPPASPAAATLWGLGRVLASEYPEHWGGLVDLDPLANAGEVEALCDAVLTTAGEDEIAVRGGQRLVSRVVRRPGLGRETVKFRPDASYLITGGTGGIGKIVARWMATAGARHLVLAGRRPEEAVAGTIAELESTGARVLYIQGDVADAGDVADVFATIAREAPPLRGIVHCAADTVDGTLLHQTMAGFDAVMGPKVTGAWNLANASRNLSLDFLTLFSSIGALLGLPGLANYVAANATVDALAASLRASGVPATSVAWGHWHNIGLAAKADRRESFQHRGLAPMPPEAGVAALSRILAMDAVTHLAVVNVEWPRYLAHIREIPPRFRELAAEFGDETNRQGSASGPSLREQLGAAPPADRRDLLLENVRAHAAAVLHFDDPQRIAPRQGFTQMGMDSLLTTELKNRLQQVTGLSLPPTLAFDYPTPLALTEHLLAELFPAEPEPLEPEPHENGAFGLPELAPDELRNLLDAELLLIDKELGS